MVVGRHVSASQRWGREEALAFARRANWIIAIRGRAEARVRVTARTPTDAALAAAILGPTGNLRAPALLVGGTLVVGFSESVYSELLA